MSENDPIEDEINEAIEASDKRLNESVKAKVAKTETETKDFDNMSYEETIKTYEKKLDEEIEDAY